MGQKNSKGSVSVVNASGRIRLRWRFQKKRYSLNLFHFNKANLHQAKKIALQIEKDLVQDTFDVSLAKYKPLTAQEAPTTPVLKVLVEHFQDWVKNYRNMDCEKDKDYNSTRNMMRKWGKFDESTTVVHFNKETFDARTYNRRLTLLNAFFKWTTKNKMTAINPLEDVLPKKVRKTEKPSRKPFTEDEIKRILEAVKNNVFCSPSTRLKHSHYYSFLFFIFKTGVRNAEAVGLRKQCVNLTENQIHMKEVLARSLKGTNAAVRIRKETKNGKHRVIPLTKDLKEIL